MKKRFNAGKKAFQKKRTIRKNTSHFVQMQMFFAYLEDHTATATMVSEATGVPQKNICRYKRELEKVGRLWQLKNDKCKITGCKAWYLTTDPNKVPNRPPTLFDGMEGWDNG